MAQELRRRHEFFRICKYARRYDRLTGKFIIDIAYRTSTRLTPRTVAVVEAFGLGVDEEEEFVLYDNVELEIRLRDIVYITGDSGSGKSVLLKALEKDINGDMQVSTINVADIKPELDKPLIETVGKTVEEGLDLLAKVGLGDAFLFLRTYEQLSDGQKYRYKIAKMIESEAEFWILDEFAATLDRDTAKIVAYNLQKLARQLGKAVLAATTHVDLEADFSPSVCIHKRFGREITVRYCPNRPVGECSLVEEMRIEQGIIADWYELASFHYRSHKVAAPRRIFRLRRGEELCGVIVYTYPSPACFGRRIVLPRMSMKELNASLSTISRVVIHPKYRAIGLGAKLVKDTLNRAGTSFVEMLAVMAKYNPFAQKAGMRIIAEQPPPRQATRIARTLQQLGFDIQLLGSQTYLQNRLRSLNEQDLAKIKEAFIKNNHPRFMKQFSTHEPFGERKRFAQFVTAASIERLATLIKVCGFLLQTKAYLFWQNS